MLKSEEKKHAIQSDYINRECVSIQHEDNFHLLGLLLPKMVHESTVYHSNNGDKPQLKLTINKKFKYTLELEIHYVFRYAQSEKIAIKIYQDAQVAEMVYCTNIQRFIRLMGPKISPEIHMKTRAALNNFLNKWLSYLLKSGYSNHKWTVQTDQKS